MANLALFVAAWPKGMWESLIKIFYNGIGDYVWAIIVLTLVIKIVLIPLDFFQRYTTSNLTRSQAYLEPQRKKLEKQYGKNQKLLNDALTKLYKDNNVKMGSSCLVVFISMALNIAITITFWTGMNKVANFQINDQYNQCKDAYYAVYDQLIVEGGTYGEEEKAAAKTAAQKAALEKYDSIKTRFLWIDNIWRPDSVVDSIPTFKDWSTAAKQKYKTEGARIAAKEEYNNVMGMIIAERQSINGYFILPIIVVGLMFLSQFITRRATMPPKEKRAQMSDEQLKQLKTGKAMMYAMPVIMALFMVNTASLFAVYYFITTLIATATVPLVTKLINKIEKKQDVKREKELTVEYKRKG